MLTSPHRAAREVKRRRRRDPTSADQGFGGRERHWMHGIGIVVRHEDSDAAHARDQPERDEGKDEAELAAQSGGGTDIPEFGMQIAR